MTEMLRIEKEFKFDMVVCFGVSLAPYAVFFFVFFFVVVFFGFFFFHLDLPSTHYTTC